jgi:hypothetical protein
LFYSYPYLILFLKASICSRVKPVPLAIVSLSNPKLYSKVKSLGKIKTISTLGA